MGAKRWCLVVLCTALYLAPIYGCPYSLPPTYDPICKPAALTSAGLVYKLYSALWAVLVVLAAFQHTRDAQTRRRVAVLFSAMFLVLSLVMHWPYFSWGVFAHRHPETTATTVVIAVGFLLWLALHRRLARWRALWDRLDPQGAAPPEDRRRAAFWHPALALLAHHLAATTDLWALTWL